jgi:hypothetical protein
MIIHHTELHIPPNQNEDCDREVVEVRELRGTVQWQYIYGLLSWGQE